MKFNFEFAEKISRTYSDECRPLCHELKLPQTAFDILMFLANNPEYKTARDVVEIRKIKANLVSVNVDKLVNEGYLERKPVENDRRKTELVCTKKAGTVIERGRLCRISSMGKRISWTRKGGRWDCAASGRRGSSRGRVSGWGCWFATSRSYQNVRLPRHMICNIAIRPISTGVSVA